MPSGAGRAGRISPARSSRPGSTVKGLSVLVMVIMAAAWWGWPGLGLLAFFTAAYSALALLDHRHARRKRVQPQVGRGDGLFQLPGQLLSGERVVPEVLRDLPDGADQREDAGEHDHGRGQDTEDRRRAVHDHQG